MPKVRITLNDALEHILDRIQLLEEDLAQLREQLNVAKETDNDPTD